MMMKDSDVQLVRFFHRVIQKEIESHTSDVHKQSLKQVKSLRDEFRKTGSDTPDWGSSALRCAYVYHNIPSMVSACTGHFLKLLRNNDFLIQRIRFGGSCTICCISNGMAAELVSVVKALQETLYDRMKHSKLKVDVVVIHSGYDWVSLSEVMVSKLSEIVDLSGIRLNFRFLSADLTRPFTDDVKAALGQSDFVTMVHFMMSGIHKEENTLFAIQEIFRYLQEGGTLFFLDLPAFPFCDTARDTIGSFENVVDIYGPLSCDIHRMSLLCRQECLKLYCRYYGWRYCALETSNYVRAWYKRIPQATIRTASHLCNRDLRTFEDWFWTPDFREGWS